MTNAAVPRLLPNEKAEDNKTFELMLMRHVKAYSSSGLVV